MWSGSKLVLIMPAIGRGAGGEAVVPRNLEPSHHTQCTIPTQDCWGIGDEVT